MTNTSLLPVTYDLPAVANAVNVVGVVAQCNALTATVTALVVGIDDGCASGRLVGQSGILPHLSLVVVVVVAAGDGSCDLEDEQSGGVFHYYCYDDAY